MDSLFVTEFLKMNTDNRRVVCAAIRAEDGDIIVGIRHYSPDMQAQINSRFDGGKFLRRRRDEQGFVDQWGVYMTRTEAWEVAKRQNQIIRNIGVEGELYSEHLY